MKYLYLLILLNVQYIGAEDKDQRFLNFENCLPSYSSARGKLFGRTNYDHLNVRMNIDFDKVYPIAVFVPKSTEDVQNAVICGAQTDIQLVPISGGHSYGGLSFGTNDSIIIDFRNMTNISINRDKLFATIESGTLLGAVYDKLWGNGKLGAALGSCTTVAMGGLAIGGGIGYFATIYGLVIDNLVEINMVDARGKAITVDETHNTDLWWAMRGVGPGYIGIVTSVKVNVFEAADLKLTSVKLHFRTQSFTNVMTNYIKWLDWVKENDETVNSVITIRHDNYEESTRPDGPGIELLLLQIQDPQFQSSTNDFILEAQKTFSEAFLTNVTCPTFREFYKMVSYDPKGEEQDNASFYYHQAKSFYVKKPYDSESLREAQDVLSAIPTQAGGILISSEQGAIGKHQSNESAYVHRDALFNLKIFFETENKEDAERGRTWMNRFYETVKFLDSGATFPNYPERNLKDYLRRFYGSNLERLVEIKRKWDPDHYFNSEMSLPIQLP